MATPALTRARLPSEPELQSFARAAAQLLAEPLPRAPGSRAVSRQAGVGIEPFDHRDYAPGDEVRHIDWRQTARSRRPIVRRFESEAVSDWTLVIDTSSSMALSGSAKWPAALQAAAAMSYALLQLGHRVGCLAFGSRVLWDSPRGRGQHHYAALARGLAALQPRPAGERSELGACAPQLHGAATVFVISDFLADDEMRRGLGALRQRCSALHALQVGDAAETRLAPLGDVELVDETGARLAAHASEQANASAATERAAMTARLRSSCARGGIAFSAWPAGQPWQHALLHHLLRARSGR